MGSKVGIVAISEAAITLNCSRRTVERLVKKGHLVRKMYPKDRTPYITVQSIRNYKLAVEESKELTLVDVLMRVQYLQAEVIRLRYKHGEDLSEDFSLSPALSDEAQDRLNRELRKRHPELFVI